MATRLLSEYLVKKHCPELRYVRVHTSGKQSAVIYAWNDQLELTENDVTRLKRFAAGHLSPYLCCQVKAYSQMQHDRVPPVQEPPEPIAEAALNRSLDPSAVLSLVNSMISPGSLTFDRYDERTGTLHFDAATTAPLTDIEKELIRQYLYELIPVGSFFEVAYR